MNATESVHQRGERVCRPTEWTDIARFFLFNYLLHAVTVVTEPGSTISESIYVAFTAISLPFTGIVRAGHVIYRLAIMGGTNLDMALRSHALCMLVPASLSHGDEAPFEYISEKSTQVHGEFPPTLNPSLSNHTTPSTPDRNQPAMQQAIGAIGSGDPPRDPQYLEGAPRRRYCMIRVPASFEAYPLLGRSNRKNRYQLIKDWFDLKRGKVQPDPVHYTDPIIACNFNVIQTIAAIFQICYGSFELYRAEKDQLQHYGYASYQLTVIPYVLMSLVNLVAGLTGPRYPTRYLVHYRGTEPPDPASPPTSLLEDYPDGWWDRNERLEVEKQICGAVGLVYGQISHPMLDNIGRGSRKPNSRPLPSLHMFALVCVFLAAPYIIIYALTEFKPGSSTMSQRSWLMSWLVLGQYGGVSVGVIAEERYPINVVIRILSSAVFGVASFGGFVVVAQMMSHSETCQRL